MRLVVLAVLLLDASSPVRAANPTYNTDVAPILNQHCVFRHHSNDIAPMSLITYMLKRPELLPKGTRLRSTATFDNSANNPLNPDATKLIRWGEPSDEEMMGFWLAFTDPGPRPV